MLRAVEEAPDTTIDAKRREGKLPSPITEKKPRHKISAIRKIAKNSLKMMSNGLETAAARVPKDVPVASNPESGSNKGP